MPPITLSPAELERINQAAAYVRQQQFKRALVGAAVLGLGLLALAWKRGV